MFVGCLTVLICLNYLILFGKFVCALSAGEIHSVITMQFLFKLEHKNFTIVLSCVEHPLFLLKRKISRLKLN